MNNILNDMINNYQADNVYEKKNVVKEVMQEIVLCGLSRANFFDRTAFYGGTALRVFYGLERFSEDLDFSLIQKDPSFDVSAYFPILEKEVNSFGLDVKMELKNKSKESNIKSAFLKGNTQEHLLLFYSDKELISNIPVNEIIKIKLEVDINPPEYATFERQYRLQPLPYEVNLYAQSSLFAGKIHAVLGRSWQNRVKGRDLYDYIFYLSKKSKVNLRHLHARLLQSGHISDEQKLDINILKEMLFERFDKINYEQAKADVIPFIKDISMLNIWSADFFKQITKGLQQDEE